MIEKFFIPGRAWLLLCPVLVSLLDVGFTLLGQPAAYWQGNYRAVREGNDYGRALLEFGPWLFMLLDGVNHSAWFWVILRAPSGFALTIAFIVTFVHMIGAGSWLTALGLLGWLIILLLFFLIQRMFMYSVKKSDVHLI